ncbi:5'-nucleotidase; exopolyphosphatase; 3'-nucleotidase [Chthonomonas calidirosea]|uniref:5'/3'-nucleotidase SurE n=1 Tax=Chthonomonas calidirosea TaxID=454171 RepID=UPI0006DD4188|nr:5'/3'-nucleotidase SurE [Chthonomonas calidirosea]CEK16563.1 5'-nucleotidase; exopolyphosphatase; 3'-nucleotidase [Chthonomonas calidirosea]
MRILLTNDDGVQAAGLHAARRALGRIGEVFVVAPERPRSAVGHSITLHKPLRLTAVTFPDGAEGFACNGTPADCVALGYEVVMSGRCDLVVSGINAGANLGWDVVYSGTVAGAREGAVLGIPSLAVSLCLPENVAANTISFEPIATFIGQVAERIQRYGLPPHVLLNINIPYKPDASELPIAITRQGRREYVNRIAVREDPYGRPYYWLGGSVRPEEPEPGSDVYAVQHGAISITPIHLDMTAYSLMEALQGWGWETFHLEERDHEAT